MEYALGLVYGGLTLYLLIRCKRQEFEHAEEVERLNNINENLRLHIQEIERDLDRVCQENQKLNKLLER